MWPSHNNIEIKSTTNKQTNQQTLNNRLRRLMCFLVTCWCWWLTHWTGTIGSTGYCKTQRPSTGLWNSFCRSAMNAFAGDPSENRTVDVHLSIAKICPVPARITADNQHWWSTTFIQHWWINYTIIIISLMISLANSGWLMIQHSSLYLHFIINHPEFAKEIIIDHHPLPYGFDWK